MAGLRRALYVSAAVTAVFGLALAVAPHWAIVTVGKQPPLADYAGARAFGVGAFVQAMLMVMVANHIEENWWWSWAFVVLAAGLALVGFARAISAPGDESSYAWWGFGGGNAVFALQLVWGLAKTGTQRPPV